MAGSHEVRGSIPLGSTKRIDQKSGHMSALLLFPDH